MGRTTGKKNVNGMFFSTCKVVMVLNKTATNNKKTHATHLHEQLRSGGNHKPLRLHHKL